MSNIILNAGTNYTLYYNVLDYFETIMNNHPSIEQVSQGDFSLVDDNQFPTYPLGNINILAADFNDSTTDYTIQIIIADKQKNKNNESQGRTNEMGVPFYGVDDVVDIHANTLGIVNDLVSFTQYSVEAFQIIGEISNEPFADRFNNGLAGWVSTFTLIAHNDRPRCLFNLYPTTTTTTAGPATTTTTTTAGPTTTTTTSTTSTTSTTTAGPTTTTTTSVGQAWSVKYNGNDVVPAVCTQPTTTLYTAGPTIGPGVQMYLDSGLTIPFSGGPGGLANYIWFASTFGITFSNDVNGVLIAPVQIGDSC